MATFRELKVWQKGMDLTRAIYSLCRTFPREELFGLSSQMRRAAVSIPSNIAEGYGRDTANDKIHFMFISLGSAQELETQLILAHDFRFISDEEYFRASLMISEVEKMLSSLIYTLKYHRTTK